MWYYKVVFIKIDIFCFCLAILTSYWVIHNQIVLRCTVAWWPRAFAGRGWLPPAASLGDSAREGSPTVVSALPRVDLVVLVDVPIRLVHAALLPHLRALSAIVAIPAARSACCPHIIVVSLSQFGSPPPRQSRAG